MSTYWVSLLLLLMLLVLTCQAATIEDQVVVSEPRTLGVDANSLQPYNADDGYPDNDGIRRFECPTGFFRLRGFCYYLSAGTAGWRDAHFHCTARNATLAVLSRGKKDKLLRNYLMGEQFRKLERWIGGIYNWRKMVWEWGVSGEKVLFQKYSNPDTAISKNHAWHCLVLDPTQQYKWTPRSCLEHKYYICEVPAGRIERNRRRKSSDSLAPQNQLLRPANRRENERRRLRNQSMQRKKAHHRQEWMLEDNQIWVHGMKPGSRPPQGLRRRLIKHQRLGQIRGPHRVHKQRHPQQQQQPQQQSQQQHQQQQHHHQSQYQQQSTPESRISQVTPAPGEYGAFPADGRIKPDEQQLQSLGTVEEVPFPRLFGNDFTREEILLKL